MITREKLRNFIVNTVMGVTLLISGCGINETTIYTVPNWTPNGQIIARRYYMKTSTNLMSNRHLETQRSEVVVMNADGSGERALFADDENSISLIAMSPLGSYVAYIDSEGKLNLYAAAGGWHRVWDVVLGDYYDNIRFSPNERLLYVSGGSYKFKVFQIDGTQIVYKEGFGGGGEFIADDVIALNQDTTTELKLSTYLVSEDVFKVLALGVYIDRYVASENKVVSLSSSTSIANFSLTSHETTEINFSFSPYSYDDFTGIQLSSDGQRLVMSYNSVEDVGIYVLDSVNGGIIQLR